MTVAEGAMGFCLVLTTVQLVSTATARWRCPARRTPLPPPTDAPAVSILRPVCGLDNFADETLRSSFLLDYPRYEVLFCAARADDPVLPLVRQLIAEYPQVPSRVLIGDERVNNNPKLNNTLKGWKAAAHDWVIMADSNVAMPRDYVQRLLASWGPDTGLVCSTPIGARPDGFWAEVECGFLNTLQARWQYAAEAIGLGFAQGKSMLWHKPMLESVGGIRVLGSELAEDAAATKLVRRNGKKVKLVDSPFEQPLGHRTFDEVWSRQVRWARLRRVTFPLFFTPEILTGALWPVLAAAFGAASVGSHPAVAALAVALIWYLAEAELARGAGWRLTWRSAPAWIVRDLLLPVMFVTAWLANDFVWRGNAMDVSETEEAR